MHDKLTDAADELVHRLAELVMEFPDIAPRIKFGVDSFDLHEYPDSGTVDDIQASASESDEGQNPSRDLVSIIESRDVAWTVPQIAKLLSLSSRALYDLVQSGSLPAYKIGTAIRLCPTSTATWLRDRLTVPT